MMSFEEFAENVVKEIRVKVGGAFQIKEHKVIKNNSVKRAGIAVMKNEEDIGPCVYLDEFYREYESDGISIFSSFSSTFITSRYFSAHFSLLSPYCPDFLHNLISPA